MRSLLSLFLLLFLVTPAYAGEIIFVSCKKADVHKDGSVSVIADIDVKDGVLFPNEPLLISKVKNSQQINNQIKELAFQKVDSDRKSVSDSADDVLLIGCFQ